MEKETFEIIWGKNAEKQLSGIFGYIVKDSFQQAEKVIDAIVTQVDAIAKNPEKFPPDKYKRHNDGSYRAFTKFRYRVSYRVSKKTILVLRIRHTSRKVKPY